MSIHHIAIWVDDLESLRDFYVSHFGATSGSKYINEKRGFSSYFLSFGEGATQIELMNSTDVVSPTSRGNMKGLAHLAISVGGSIAVDDLTERLRQLGVTIVGEPRTSGDGYYESVILDPEGNRVEILG